MAIDIKSLRKVSGDKPPIVLIYGPEKVGKTSLAAEFPAPVFIQTEDGTPSGVTLDSFGLLENFADVISALGSLATEKHGFQTAVVDSISKLERLVWLETCARHGWDSIETPGFGKGYIEADYVWTILIDTFRYLRDNSGLSVVLIGHSLIERFDDPETQSYNRYQIDLHKRAVALLTREVDAILLVKRDVTIKEDGSKTQIKRGEARPRGVGGNSRWIHTEGRPAYQAGNRYSMPDRLLFEKGKGFDVLAPYLPIHRPEPASSKKKEAV